MRWITRIWWSGHNNLVRWKDPYPPNLTKQYGRKCSKDAAIGRHQEEMEYRGFGLKLFPEMRVVQGKTLWRALKYPKTMIEPWLVRGRTIKRSVMGPRRNTGPSHA